MRVRPTLPLPGLAGAFTLGAGLVHAAAAVTHQGDGQLAALFALTAVVQVVLAVAATARPARPVLVGVVLVNLAVAGAWTASRLTGLPVVGELAERQPVGFQDVTATLLEVLALGAAACALARREPMAALRFSPLWVLALLPATAGMASPHSHPAGPHHAESAREVGGEASLHAQGEHREEAPRGLAADPVFSGADTSRVSEPQLAAAKALVVVTRDAVGEAFPDEESLLRAGYRSIGDGRFPGTFEHFVHPGYLSDGRELDPGHIESIVLENTGTGKRVVSAMYILELGKTMADVPDVAGELTAWHDHQNLCWDETGTRLAGVLLGGRCVPRGTFRPTPPMLHVWLQDHECGPFAGIDGHGAICGGHHSAP